MAAPVRSLDRGSHPGVWLRCPGRVPNAHASTDTNANAPHITNADSDSAGRFQPVTDRHVSWNEHGCCRDPNALFHRDDWADTLAIEPAWNCHNTTNANVRCDRTTNAG